MKISLQICGFFALVSISIYLSSHQTDLESIIPTAVHQKRPVTLFNPISQTQVHESQPRLKSKAITASIFADEPTATRKILSDVEDDINSERARETFKRSGLENPKNYFHAHEILRQEYRIPLTRHDAERRVLALHFLGATEFLSNDDCMKTLETQINLYAKSAIQIQKALIWDIYGIAQLCARSDSEGVESLAAQTNIREIRAQIELAVSKSGKDSFRTN